MFDKLPYYTDVIFFSGIKGEITPVLKASDASTGKVKLNYDPNPINFTLFKEKNIILHKHVLFDIN